MRDIRWKSKVCANSPTWVATKSCLLSPSKCQLKLISRWIEGLKKAILRLRLPLVELQTKFIGPWAMLRCLTYHLRQQPSIICVALWTRVQASAPVTNCAPMFFTLRQPRLDTNLPDLQTRTTTQYTDWPKSETLTSKMKPILMLKSSSHSLWVTIRQVMAQSKRS